MATVKAGLKAAKAAIDAQKFEEAAKQAQNVLTLDPQNYFACDFSPQIVSATANTLVATSFSDVPLTN
jgi:hypothetical protein